MSSRTMHPVFAALASVYFLVPAFAFAGEPGPAPAPDPLEAWWKHARAKIERILEEQGRTPEAVENPKWFEQPYVTAGRMPLVDRCLAQPLAMPEVAGTADRRVREEEGRLVDLFVLSGELAGAAKMPNPGQGQQDATGPDDLGRIQSVQSAMFAAIEDLFLLD